jgi:predicted HAD superfamily Cof-like phosphohydrolase
MSTRPDADPLAHTSPLGAALAEFNAAFGAEHRPWPTATIPAETVALRARLLAEECRELLEAIEAGDLEQIAKESADLAYVLRGTTDAYGIDLDAAIEAVHASNMSKVGPDGSVLRDAGGKVLKGPHYRLPDMRPILGLPAQPVSASGAQVGQAA